MSRARRLLDGAPESTAHGYLAYLAAIHVVLQRHLGDLPVRVRELQEICSRLDDSALTARALVAQGARGDPRRSDDRGVRADR